MKLRRLLLVSLFSFAAAVPMGCGGGEEAEPADDPLMEEGAEDPATADDDGTTAP